MDLFGYTCQTIPTSFVASATKLALSSDDTSQMVPLPFAFCHYVISYSNAHVSANGYLSFKELDPTYSSPENKEIQDYWEPDAAICAFWDNLLVDANAGIYTAAQGSAPNRQFIIEWRNVARADDPTKRVSFEIMLHQSGPILLQYADIAANNLERGGSATVEMENANSYIAFQYASDQPVLSNSRAIRFMPPFTNLLQNPGFEEDANMDSYQIAGASTTTTEAGMTRYATGRTLGSTSPQRMPATRFSRPWQGSLRAEVQLCGLGQHLW